VSSWTLNHTHSLTVDCQSLRCALPVHNRTFIILITLTGISKEVCASLMFKFRLDRIYSFGETVSFRFWRFSFKLSIHVHFWKFWACFSQILKSHSLRNMRQVFVEFRSVRPRQKIVDITKVKPTPDADYIGRPNKFACYFCKNPN